MSNKKKRNITQDTAIHYANELVSYMAFELKPFCLEGGCDSSCDYMQSCVCYTRGELLKFLKREGQMQDKSEMTH